MATQQALLQIAAAAAAACTVCDSAAQALDTALQPQRKDRYVGDYTMPYTTAINLALKEKVFKRIYVILRLRFLRPQPRHVSVMVDVAVSAFISNSTPKNSRTWRNVRTACGVSGPRRT